MKRKAFQPTEWQRNPESLKTSNVQWWTKSGTMMGLIDLAKAKEIVAAGGGFVICEQAIELYS